MKRLSNFTWEIEQADIDHAAPLREPGIIQFHPLGWTHPLRFEFGSRCGMMMNPGIHVQVMDRLGGGVMTHRQARELLAFLREHEHLLTDDEQAGDIQEDKHGFTAKQK